MSQSRRSALIALAAPSFPLLAACEACHQDSRCGDDADPKQDQREVAAGNARSVRLNAARVYEARLR
jgi:hypothetical protein